MQNRQIVLVSRPTGMPALSNFQILDIEVPGPKEGEILLKTLYLSVDPYMRGRMNDRESYVPPFALHQAITGGAVAEIVASRASGYQAGEIVTGMLDWQLYSVAKPQALRKIDPTLAPITTALGILGIPGLTAYFGLLDIGQPKSGETLVVSGAAGAVGMTVCQIGKMKGCNVVGIAGGEGKKQFLQKELLVDSAIDYRNVRDLRPSLTESCPAGIDIYFDNVGGDISDAVLPLISKRARIVICGQISMYNLDGPDVGLRAQPFVLVKSALMKGFIVIDYAARFGQGMNQLTQWLKAGKLRYAENVVNGFENTPRAFLGLFAGENLGKQLVKVAD